MKKFIAIASERMIAGNRLPPHRAAEQAGERLQANSTHKVVQLLPHIFLFEFKGKIEAAVRFALACFDPLDEVIVIEVHNDFRGGTTVETNRQLRDFFARSDAVGGNASASGQKLGL